MGSESPVAGCNQISPEPATKISYSHADPTDSECPSHSDFDILRSSIYRMGKMGGGSVTDPPGPTCSRPGRTFGRVTTPGSDPLLTSHNSRTHFTIVNDGGIFSVGPQRFACVIFRGCNTPCLHKIVEGPQARAHIRGVRGVGIEAPCQP